MRNLSEKDKQDLTMFVTRLAGGYKSHALELLDGSDPTGGTVALDDQIYGLYRQYVATWRKH